jgi:hypothetical protein
MVFIKDVNALNHIVVEFLIDDSTSVMDSIFIEVEYSNIPDRITHYKEVGV